MRVTPIVSRSEPPEVLELVEAAFDMVAGFVEALVERKRAGPLWVRRDHGLGPHGADVVPQRVAVVGGIGDDGFSLAACEQHGRGNDVMNLTRREEEAQRPAEPFGKHMNLGGQSSSGTPQSLVAAPPFPVAAC